MLSDHKHNPNMYYDIFMMHAENIHDSGVLSPVWKVLLTSITIITEETQCNRRMFRVCAAYRMKDSSFLQQVKETIILIIQILTINLLGYCY